MYNFHQITIFCDMARGKITVTDFAFNPSVTDSMAAWDRLNNSENFC